VLSVTLAAGQTSPARDKLRVGDQGQDKRQKTLPARTPGSLPVTPSPSSPAVLAGVNRSAIVDGSTLSKEQFRALPSSTLIQVQGRQVTKQAMLDQVKPWPQRASTISSQQRTARLNELRGRFLQKQQAELRARNEKVMAAFAQRRGHEEAFTRSAQFLKIHSEAISLQSEYDRASLSQKTRLEARARELQRQLQNLKASNLH